MKSSQASAGFTLQEMLVVMAIMGIVAAMAVPSFRDFAIQRSIAAQITDLTSALRLARSEALKRGREVSLCPTDDPSVANGRPKCTNSRDWKKGYLVFIGSIYANDQYIRVQQPYSNGGSILADDVGGHPLPSQRRAEGGGAPHLHLQAAAGHQRPILQDLEKKVCVSSTGVLAPC